MWHLLEPLHGVCQQWVGLLTSCLGIASDIESTSLLCRPSSAGARHRRRMSSQVCSLYRCESGWSKRVLDIHTIWITYSSYRYGPWRVVINAYFSSDLVQFYRGGTTQNLGGLSQKLGQIDRVWGGSTRGGSTLGRIVCKLTEVTTAATDTTDTTDHN